MKKIFAIILTFLILLVPGCSRNDAIRFNQYLDKVFISFLEDDPLIINALLYHPEKYNLHEQEVLPLDFSLEAEEAYFNELKAIKAELMRFNNKYLPKREQLTKEILIDYLNRELAFEGLYYYGSLLGSYLGYQANLPLNLAEYRFDDLSDVYNYFAYLKTTQASFQAIIEYEYQKLELGLGLTTTNIERIIDQCNNLIYSEENFLVPIFNDKIKAMKLGKAKQEQLSIQNEKLVYENFIGAYRYLRDHLSIMKAMSTNTPVLNQDKQKYYEALFQKQVGVDLSMEDVISYLDNLLVTLLEKRIKNKIDYEIVGSSYNLIEDRRFDDIIPFFKEAMTDDFPAIPNETQYAIKEIHQSLQNNSSPAMYFLSPIDINTLEVIYINPLNFKTTNNYVFQTLAHESYPGHLYQNAYLKSLDLHNIRKLLSYPGYAEGWATYVENYVVKYAGGNQYVHDIFSFYNSFPYLVLGRLDVGINYQGWNLEESVAFLEQYFNLDSIDEYQTYYDMLEVPTNYLKYYLSYYKILDLKNYFREIAGNDYSDYLFHKIYLDTGPAPFWILEKEYQNYR